MQQIASYWISKHGTDNCQTATAVAMAESGGNCGARNVNSDSHSSVDRGLWQINDYWHPECSDSTAYDCSGNAGCAVNVWKSSGWSAWATYNAGLHQKYMNDAAVACGYSDSEEVGESFTEMLDMKVQETCSPPTGAGCCGAPGGDVHNCPDSARTPDCDAQGACCCGFLGDSFKEMLDMKVQETCSPPTGAGCCGAPGGDVHNCPDSARTPDCDAQGACCCGFLGDDFLKPLDTLESTLQVGYSPTQAVSWADAHCGTDDGTECAEFASNAIKAGGSASGCFHTYVPDLDNCLKNNAGWKQTSFPCSSGSVVIWTDGTGPYHAAISRGDGTIDQHNPSRCGTSGSWGSNYCLSPPSFTATENVTVLV